MSDKTPRDRFGGIDPDDEGFGFPGGEDDGLTEDERRFSFDEDYMDKDVSARREREIFDYDAEEPLSPKENALVAAFKKLAARDGAKNDAPAAGQKKRGFLSRMHSGAPAPRKKRGKDADYGEKAPVTVGMDLRADQMLVYDSELDEIDYTDEEDLPEARDYMPIRFRRYGRIGIGGGILYALFVISASIVLACLAWLFASDVLALNKEDYSAIVTIEKYEPADGESAVNSEGNTINVDIDQVATALKNAGIIEYKWLFKLYSRFSSAETKIDPGTYEVLANLDYRALVSTLQFGSGSQEITQITFPEGFTLEQIFTLLEENQICEKSDLYEASANHEFDYDFLEGLAYGDENRLEGYLFPDTYEFYQGESAAVAINRFLSNFNSKITDDMKSRASSLGLSLHELITLASLVEKEAGGDSERTTVASVIYNRLNADWKLQLDSTLNYIKGTSTFDLTYDDTEIDSPYNTYLYEGLPIGPICSPGLASIEAALYPESTDYWFFYAYDGETTFFTNKDDFDAFVDSH